MAKTGTLTHGSLVWNLFLAWIPAGLALLAYNLYRKGSCLGAALVLPIAAVWLLFFPNAPYLITDIVHLAQSLERVDEMHILPYHRMGQAKYDQLDRAYALKGVLPPSEDQAREWAAMVEKLGIKCRIRG